MAVLSVCAGCQSQSASDPSHQPAASNKDKQQAIEQPAASSNAFMPLGPVTAEEKKAIQSVFRNFKVAVLSYKGTTATRYLAQSSLTYYAHLLTAARTALNSPKDFERLSPQLSPALRANIAVIIERLSYDFIMKATPEALYEVAFNQGWIGYQTFQTASLDNLQAFDANGKRYVTGDLYYEGTIDDKHITRLGFWHEDDTWRIDLTTIFVAVDQAIQTMINKDGLDADALVKEAIQDSQARLLPQNWPPFISKTDSFTVRFPRDPLYEEVHHEGVYSAQHHRYGQFLVNVSRLDPSDLNSPYHHPETRKTVVTDWLMALGSDKPDCSQRITESFVTVQCAFSIPQEHTRGLATWVFNPQHRYLIANYGRDTQFDLETAQHFIHSFAFGDTRQR